jgi:hypothetical protein
MMPEIEEGGAAGSGHRFVRSAQFGVAILRLIAQGPRPGHAPTLLAMDIDAALILVSFVSFFGLVLSWVVAPLRADAPVTAPVLGNA